LVSSAKLVGVGASINSVDVLPMDRHPYMYNTTTQNPPPARHSSQRRGDPPSFQPRAAGALRVAFINHTHRLPPPRIIPTLAVLPPLHTRSKATDPLSEPATEPRLISDTVERTVVCSARRSRCSAERAGSEGAPSTGEPLSHPTVRVSWWCCSPVTQLVSTSLLSNSARALSWDRSSCERTDEGWATHQSSGVLVYIRITRFIACCAAGPPARLLRHLSGFPVRARLSPPRGVAG
jgi:hypothetical protein